MEILLKGSKSGLTYNLQNPIWRGENNEFLDLEFSFQFSRDKIDNHLPGFWRYLGALPIDSENDIISIGEQITPIVSLELRSGNRVQIKSDFLFPTGSYKDRGAAILLSQMKKWGVKELVQDSSGNAGVSIAAYAAAAEIHCKIFVPEETSASKITQMLAYGAEIIRVPGGRKNTAKRAFEEAKGSFYASHCFHPLFMQGTKTFVYEIWDQTNGNMPDTIVLPAGNGTLLLGCFIGLKELLKLRLIKKMPKLIGIQSKNCAPLVQLVQNNQFNLEEYLPKDTIAEGIAIPNPIRANQMVQAVLESGGRFITVEESQIIETWKFLAKKGFYVEPTSATSIAGIEQYVSKLDDSENIMGVFTGSGLKTTEKIQSILDHY